MRQRLRLGQRPLTRATSSLIFLMASSIFLAGSFAADTVIMKTGSAVGQASSTKKVTQDAPRVAAPLQSRWERWLAVPTMTLRERGTPLAAPSLELASRVDASMNLTLGMATMALMLRVRTKVLTSRETMTAKGQSLGWRWKVRTK